jgi:hypothetical protein
VTNPSGLVIEYHPPYDNLMSYYQAAAEFTPQQKQRMMDVLWFHENRAYLIDELEPTCKDLYIASSKGKVERVLLTNMNSWAYEPVADIIMQMNNNIAGSTCLKTTMLPFGEYSSESCFYNLLDLNGTVHPELTFNHEFNPIYAPLNGVTTNDLIRITKHILSIELLQAPYLWIAADANNNGAITIQDIIKLRKLILGIETTLGSTPSWRFVPQYYLFPQWNFVSSFEQNPFTSELEYVNNTSRRYLEEGGIKSFMDQLELLEYTEDIELEETWSFFIIKTGDVNTDAGVNINSLPLNHYYEFSEDFHACLQSGLTATVNVTMQSTLPIEGYQFGIQANTDAIEILGINKAEVSPFSLNHFNLLHISNGEIKTSWHDEIEGQALSTPQSKSLFSIHIKAKREICHIADDLNIDTSLMYTAFYDDEGAITEPVLSLKLIPQQIRHQVIAVFPNPTSEDVIFTLKVNDTPELVTINVQDQTGNVIQHSGNYAIGEHTISLPNGDTLASGLISYTVQIGGETFSGNIIKL